MLKNKYQKVVIWLLGITLILFVLFDYASGRIIKSMFIKQTRDVMYFQASETLEAIYDYEKGLSMLESSYKFNVKRSLHDHVKFVQRLMELSRQKQFDMGVDDEFTQKEVLSQIDVYRKQLGGTIAIYSREKGMLLYPEGRNGTYNILFDQTNQELLDHVLQDGEHYGYIRISDASLNEKNTESYFIYDKLWDWTIFAVNDVEHPVHETKTLEQITILDSLKPESLYESIDRVYILDLYDRYEYVNNESLVGQKLRRIDLRSNKALTDIFMEDGYVSYLQRNPETSGLKEQLLYTVRTNNHKHTVVVEASMDSVDGKVNVIRFRLRLMAGLTFVVLMLILLLLYQNFIILVDPLTMQHREVKK